MRLGRLLMLLLLTATAGLGWALAHLDSRTTPDIEAPPAGFDQHFEDLPTFRLEPLESFTHTRERPLFWRERAPFTFETYDHEAEEVEVIEQASYVLHAVIIVGNGKQALLYDDKADEVLWVREGETVGAWRVERIRPGAVTLHNNAVSTEIRLRPQDVEQE